MPAWQTAIQHGRPALSLHAGRTPQQAGRRRAQRHRNSPAVSVVQHEASTSTSADSLPSSPSPSGQQGDVLIEFRNVHKSFGDKSILAGASFKIRRGEAVGIIGASGTGKSTTLRLAAGLLAPDRGEVLICGKPRLGLLSDQAAEEGALSVGMVFQNAALFDSLTVGENVGFLLYEHTSLPKDLIRERVARSLGKVSPQHAVAGGGRAGRGRGRLDARACCHILPHRAACEPPAPPPPVSPTRAAPSPPPPKRSASRAWRSCTPPSSAAA
jgi:ABC-type glutathione transport system ATPase component